MLNPKIVPNFAMFCPNINGRSVCGAVLVRILSCVNSGPPYIVLEHATLELFTGIIRGGIHGSE